MNFTKFFILSLLALMYNSCGGGNTTTSELFSIELEGNKTKFQQHDKVKISIKSKKGTAIDNVVYSIDNKVVNLENGSIKTIKVLAANPPAVYTYEIVNTFPHDIKAFTQGLEFHQDTLYETTGKKGRSSLRKVNFNTGEVLQQVDLDNAYFGEGLTVLNDKIYQLTWQSGTGFVYRLSDLKKTDSFKYGASKEGWGLCNDGEHLYKSDGTEKIWLLNPETLVEEGYIQTVTNKSVFNKANELEYVDGKIYANVWQKESMMIINATSGAIEGVINFSGLKEKVTAHKELDVLNGVAYHPARKTFFVTGKNWDKMFEVTLRKK